MTQRPSLSITALIEPAQLEATLWAACPLGCSAAGGPIVSAIAVAIAHNKTSDLELKDPAARDAAVELIACAAFVKTAASAFSVFSLRERRPPSTHELVLETAKLDGPIVGDAYAQARCYTAQRSPC